MMKRKNKQIVRKIFSGFLLVLLTGFISVQADDPPVKVFIFAGQSNLPKGIFGDALPPDLASWVSTSPENDCLYFFDSFPNFSTDWETLHGFGLDSNVFFNAEHIFAYYLNPYFKSIDPNQRIAFIQVQRSSTSLINAWNAGGRVMRPDGTTPAPEKEVHVSFRTTITNALSLLSRPVVDGGQGLTYEVVGLIWNQGEGDMLSDGGSLSYPAHFRDLIGEWVDDPSYPLDDTNLYTGGLRSGFIDPSSGAHSPAYSNAFVLTTRIPLLQAETKPWGDAKYYGGPIGTLRIRDSLTDGNEAGENIQGIVQVSSNVWWMSCDEFSLKDEYHLENRDRTKMSTKYAATYLSDILGLGCDAVDFWPSMLTSGGFEWAVKDPYVGSPTYSNTVPFLFGSAAVANAHTRRYPQRHDLVYPLNTQATKVWWTGTDQRWTKTNPDTVGAEHEAVFNGTEPGRLVQVLCDSHSIRKALKISFDVKSLDLDGSPNGLSVSLYGATTAGTLDYTDPSQPDGQYLPSDFAVALDNEESNSNVELLGTRIVLDTTSGQPNELTMWTPITLNADMVDPAGYSYLVLVFEGDNVQTNSGDFLGVDNVVMIPAEKSIPQIVLSTSTLSVPEGSTSSFDIKLSLPPESGTTVTVSRISGDTNLTVQSGSSLIFTTSNWMTNQLVTLVAAQDDDWINSNALFRCSADGLLSRYLTVTEDDDEIDPAYALPWNESFEVLAQGTLDGQHGWTAEAGAVVTNLDAQSGSQSLFLSAATASHTFDGAPTSIWIEFWSKPVRAMLPGEITGNVSAVFYVNTNDNLVVYSNTTAITLGTTVSNGWNKFGIECDYVSRVWKLELNDTPVAGDLPFYGSPASFSEIELQSTAGETAFIDSITVSDESDPSDVDSDGLPDEWELLYYGGLSPNPGDSASNGVNTVLQAYIAGLDPTSPTNRFLLSSVFSSPSSVLSWNSFSGRVYTVYWTSNLLSSFQSLESNVLWTDNTFTDALHSAEDKGFYKIEVQLNP